MKNLIKTILIILTVMVAVNFLLNRFFFRTHLDKQPEINVFKIDTFDILTSKPYFYKIDNQLFYSRNGQLYWIIKPIWKGEIEEAFISPNSQFALIYAKNELTLINNIGKELFKIGNCTELIPIEEKRETGRFLSSVIQWSKNSDYFLIGQDRFWDKNFSNKNKSSIYKYSLTDESFNPLILLDEEVSEDFFLSQDEKYLFYEFATIKGDLAFKKVDLQTKTVISEHFQDDSLRLTNLKQNSVFINYLNPKEQFQANSYNLQTVISEDIIDNKLGLYFIGKDKTVKILTGLRGYSGFKGHNYSYFKNGYFLPGDRFFIANVHSKQFTGQLIIDTKTFKIMKTPKMVDFYFNINTNDCTNFVFRYAIEPNVPFGTSIHIDTSKVK